MTHLELLEKETVDPFRVRDPSFLCCRPWVETHGYSPFAPSGQQKRQPMLFHGAHGVTCVFVSPLGEG
jgi:hypothetical protein